MNRTFYVKNKKNEIIAINEEDFIVLGHFASHLDFMPEVRNEHGINVELDFFFKQNPSHFLAETYSKINTTPEGNLLLNFNIALSDLEKKFRQEGIKGHSVNSYNDLLKACSEMFAANNEEFAQESQKQPN